MLRSAHERWQRLCANELLLLSARRFALVVVILTVALGIMRVGLTTSRTSPSSEADRSFPVSPARADPSQVSRLRSAPRRSPEAPSEQARFVGAAKGLEQSPDLASASTALKRFLVDGDCGGALMGLSTLYRPELSLDGRAVSLIGPDGERVDTVAWAACDTGLLALGPALEVEGLSDETLFGVIEAPGPNRELVWILVDVEETKQREVEVQGALPSER